MDQVQKPLVQRVEEAAERLLSERKVVTPVVTSVAVPESSLVAGTSSTTEAPSVAIVPNPGVTTVTETVPVEPTQGLDPVPAVPTTESLPLSGPGSTPVSPTGAFVDVSAVEQVPTDVSLLRAQLEQVVTNFRSRIDTHDGILKEITSGLAVVVSEVESHKSVIESLVKALEALK